MDATIIARPAVKPFMRAINPRIYHGFKWMCWDMKHGAGLGVTPEDAYGEWKAVTHG